MLEHYTRDHCAPLFFSWGFQSLKEITNANLGGAIVRVKSNLLMLSTVSIFSTNSQVRYSLAPEQNKTRHQYPVYLLNNMFSKTYPTRQLHLTDNAKTVPQAERVCEGTPVCLSGKQLTTLEPCKLSHVKGKTARLGQCKRSRVKQRLSLRST